ncbi:hypothetical protein SAMN05878443_1828 [Carnobacterium alterfunditum]|uniref:Uncharacterized protein n=1 Tax=Carnobacterium alterfunditum TaxID=28230 RepID=A0A1N6HFJ7_9LACT|nr:hypothetical protein SAMN05878443_1828 [Carnobacterium alterfunditum]
MQLTKPEYFQPEYIYVIKGRNQTIRLDVENADVLINADGMIDCPIDTVLRKNEYTFNDLNSWSAEEIQFILIKNDDEQILRTVKLNVNL